MGQVSWSWEADVKEGKLARFKKDVVVPWNIFAAADPDTLISRWAVDDEQFAVNECWGKLDEYLEPTAMYVFGDYGKDLDFLREHGAIFMLDL